MLTQITNNICDKANNSHNEMRLIKSLKENGLLDDDRLGNYALYEYAKVILENDDMEIVESLLVFCAFEGVLKEPEPRLEATKIESEELDDDYHYNWNNGPSM